MRLPASLHGKNALLLAVALAATIPYGWRAAGSAALGGGIQVVNLRGLERSVAAFVSAAGAGARGGLQPLLGLRWGLLLVCVAVALLALPVSPLPFLVGLSTPVPAVIWHGLATARTGTGAL